MNILNIFRRPIIFSQIEEYYRFKLLKAGTALIHKECLIAFVEAFKIVDAAHIDRKHIEEFTKWLEEGERSNFHIGKTTHWSTYDVPTAFRCFLQWFKLHSGYVVKEIDGKMVSMKRPMLKRVGRKPDLREILRIKTLKDHPDLGYSFREISRMIRKDLKSVYRSYKYPMGRVLAQR